MARARLGGGFLFQALLPVRDRGGQSVFLLGQGSDFDLKSGQFGAVCGDPVLRVAGLLFRLVEAAEVENEDSREQRIGGQRNNQACT